MTDLPDVSHVVCKYCHVRGKVRLELRDEIEALPLGSHSLSGNQMKVSARSYKWPWAVCDNCGHESRGKVAEPTGEDQSHD